MDKKIERLKSSHRDFLTKGVSESFFLCPVTDCEIIDLVNLCKNKTSCGWDSISMTVVKKTINNIASPLAHLMNMSFTSGCVPCGLKIARVLPIFKCDDRNEFSNYRPISILPCFSKIMERLMYNRLEIFLNKHEVLIPEQYGFRKKLSTELALIDMSDNIARSIDDKKLTIGIFVDLSKAFDTLNHEILIDKLAHYGIRGVAQKWFRSYLENREQFVAINDNRSLGCKISTGVPQGSILGPILFLLYINDIVNSSKFLRFILFADDTNIFYSGSNTDELFRVINQELAHVVRWFKVNRLSVNLKKTNFVIFGNTSKIKNLDKYKIFLDSTVIERKTCAKFLGVIVDDKLTWNNHIECIEKKILKNIGIIRKVQSVFPISVLNTLYCSLILPYLTYCNVIWSNNRITRLYRLNILQKRAIRVVNKCGYIAHTQPLFAKSRQLNLIDLNKLCTAAIIYRFHNNDLPDQFQNYFVLNSSIHEHLTRSHNRLHIPYARTVTLSCQLRIAGPKLWNGIDPTILVISQHIRKFKQVFKNHLLSFYN